MNISSTQGDKESTTVHYYFSLTRPVSQSAGARLFFSFNAILVIYYELKLVLMLVSKPGGLVALRGVF